MLTRRTALTMLPAGLFAPYLSRAHTRVRPGNFGTGLNLSGTNYWASEQPFANLAHNAAPWRLQVGNAPFTWDNPLPPLTSLGYPTHIPTGSFLESFLVYTPHRHHLPLNLFFYFEGQGRFTFTGGAEIVSRHDGFDRIRNLRRPDAITLCLHQTHPDDPLRNIRLFDEEQKSDGDFRTRFLDRLKGMSVLRFMDWMSTNNSRVRTWKERPVQSSFGRSEDGVALETLVDLSNRTGIAPWFNLPHGASNKFVENFAETVRTRLDPSLPVFVEYSNEVWNSIFQQSSYAQEQGLASNLSNNPFEAQLRFYAKRTTEVLKIWERVFGDDAKRIKGVYAAQSANPWTSETILNFPDVLRHADVLAIAPYFGGLLGSPEMASRVQSWSLDKLFTVLRNELETSNQQQILAQAQIARQYGLELVAYEGGQHLVGIGGAENNDRLTDLFIAANRDVRMKELYRRHLAIWENAGGGTYAFFSSMSEPSKWGSWGLLEHEDDEQPKWDAIQMFLGH